MEQWLGLAAHDEPGYVICQDTMSKSEVVDIAYQCVSFFRIHLPSVYEVISDLMDLGEEGVRRE
jgi:hypothetical protein